MKTTIHGSLAVAALCALLTACGGGGSPSPTVLPASVTITSDARVEAGSAETFSTDLSVTGGLTFHWDFGDGSTGAGASVSHAYAKPGQYQVTLAVANSAQDLRTASSSIQVGAYSNVSGLNCTQSASGGWCWQHAIATGHAINDIFFLDATHVWAVGDALTLLKSADGGATWTAVPLDSALAAASLRSIRFYDAMHGLALNDQGTALQTRDGGNTWTINTLGGLVGGGAATFVDYGASRIIVQSYYAGSAAMSVDGGTTWTYVAANGQMQATATDCWSFSASYAERAAGCGASATFALAPSSLTNGYQYLGPGTFVSAAQGLVVGYGYADDTATWTALAWSTADGGATWTLFQVDGLPSYYGYGQALHMSDALTGTFYSTGDLTAYDTQDGGHHWTAVTPASLLTQTYNGYRVTGLLGNTLWQTSANNVATSTDRGQTWHAATVHDEDSTLQNGNAAAFAVTQFTDADDFVVSTSRRFYATHDGGQTFQRILGPDTRDINSNTAAGFFFDTKHGSFVTSRGAILSTADGGRTWTRADYPTNSNQPIALHYISTTEGWLVLNGTLEHTVDGGATWSTPLTSSAMGGLQGMSWGDASHAWTWSGATLFATADAGKTWTAVTVPNNTGGGVTSAVMTGPLAGVVSLGYGSYQTTQDGGATWQAAAGVSPYGNLVRGGGQTVWSLSYTISRSKDGGKTWQAMNLTNDSSSVTGLAFADELHGWLITSSGSVLHTIDGGDSWSSQPVGTDLQLVGIVAVDTMTAWVITRDGQILATATAGN